MGCSRMLWSSHLAPMFFWQRCLFGEAKLVPRGELAMWNSALSHSGPALLPCPPGVHGQPAACPCPSLSSSLCSVQLISHACTHEFRTAPTGQSWYFGSLGFLDHCCFVLMCCTMVCSGSHASQALWELVKCLFQNQSNPNLLYW